MIAFLDELWKPVRDAFVKAFEWLRDWIWALLAPIFEPIAESVAAFQGYISDTVTALGPLADYLAFANAWAPVDLGFQLLAAYSVWWLALAIYRSVKKWIPTVSG